MESKKSAVRNSQSTPSTKAADALGKRIHFVANSDSKFCHNTSTKVLHQQTQRVSNGTRRIPEPKKQGKRKHAELISKNEAKRRNAGRRFIVVPPVSGRDALAPNALETVKRYMHA